MKAPSKATPNRPKIGEASKIGEALCALVGLILCGFFGGFIYLAFVIFRLLIRT